MSFAFDVQVGPIPRAPKATSIAQTGVERAATSVSYRLGDPDAVDAGLGEQLIRRRPRLASRALRA